MPAPDAFALSDSFACADDPESNSFVQGQAGGVLGKDPGVGL
jgi:hypothetical protein